MGRSGPHGADRATNTTSQFMRRILRSATVASTLLALAVLLHPAAASAQAQKAEKSQKAKPYPLPTCVVSGEKLGGDMGDPHIFTYKGREIKLCCKSCLKDFNKEPAKFLAKVDEAAKRVKPYTLATCLVSDEKFGGDMGEPYEFIYEGRAIKLCCKSCFKDFNKEPAKFLKKLDLAAKTAGSAEKSAGQAHEDGPHKH